jgi:hypothetical protein
MPALIGGFGDFVFNNLSGIFNNFSGIFYDFSGIFNTTSNRQHCINSFNIPRALYKGLGYFNYSTFKQTSNLGSYLAGLIERDGSIIVPTKDKSEKGKSYHPVIRIVFTINDLPLAEKLQKVLGHGKIQRGKGQFYLHDRRSL